MWGMWWWRARGLDGWTVGRLDDWTIGRLDNCRAGRRWLPIASLLADDKLSDLTSYIYAHNANHRTPPRNDWAASIRRIAFLRAGNGTVCRRYGWAKEMVGRVRKEGKERKEWKEYGAVYGGPASP